MRIVSTGCNGVSFPDSKDHWPNMGPIWVLSAPGGPLVGPMNLDIRVYLKLWHIGTIFWSDWETRKIFVIKWTLVVLTPECSGLIRTMLWPPMFNTLRSRQNGRHFPDDIFKCTLLSENVWTLIKISLKVVSKCPINNIPALVQIMAWCH